MLSCPAQNCREIFFWLAWTGVVDNTASARNLSRQVNTTLNTICEGIVPTQDRVAKRERLFGSVAASSILGSVTAITSIAINQERTFMRTILDTVFRT